MRFGRLLVIERAGSTPQKKAMWLCQCDCGTRKAICGTDLRFNKSRSCGCATREATSINRRTHGMSTTRFYKIWAGIIKRCTNENSKQFYDYGGRGIKVCDRWGAFENFRDDMYESYLNHVNEFGEKDTTIDRVEVNGNYAPDNCKWATKSEQCKNQRIRRTSKSGVLGITFHKATGKWLARAFVNNKRIYLGLFIELEDAISAKKLYESEAV